MISNIAILVTSFNRPELLERQLNFLETTNYRVYVSQDIDSTTIEQSSQKIKDCIRIIELYCPSIYKYKIYSTPQGCYRGITSAIDWVFKYEEKLIILEDDIVIDSNFLKFAEDMLTKYEDEKSIGSICATNLVPSEFIGYPENLHRLSIFTSSWGWATWKDRWQLFVHKIESPLEIQETIPKKSRIFVKYWKHIFGDTYNNLNDSWAYRWLFTNWKFNLLTIVPNMNFALNLGFGTESTHTKDHPWWLPKKISTYSGIGHNTTPIEDTKADIWMAENHFRISTMSYYRFMLRITYPSIYKLYIKYKKRH